MCIRKKKNLFAWYFVNLLQQEWLIFDVSVVNMHCNVRALNVVFLVCCLKWNKQNNPLYPYP